MAAKRQFKTQDCTDWERKVQRVVAEAIRADTSCPKRQSGEAMTKC